MSVRKRALSNTGWRMSVSNSAHLKAQSVLLADAWYDTSSATSADYNQECLQDHCSLAVTGCFAITMVLIAFSAEQWSHADLQQLNSMHACA